MAVSNAMKSRDTSLQRGQNAADNYWSKVTEANKLIEDKILNEENGSITNYKKSMERALSNYNYSMNNLISDYKHDSQNVIRSYQNEIARNLREYDPQKYINAYEANNAAARKSAEEKLGANKADYQKKLDKYTGENAARSINELASQQAVKNANAAGASTIGASLAAGLNPATAALLASNKTLGGYNDMFGQQQNLVGNQFANAAAGAGNIYGNESGNIRDLLNNATNQYATALSGNLASENTRLQTKNDAASGALNSNLSSLGNAFQGGISKNNTSLQGQADMYGNQLNSYNNAVSAEAANQIGAAAQQVANYQNQAQTGQSSQNLFEKAWNDFARGLPWNW